MSSNAIPHRGARILCSSTCPVQHIETGVDKIKAPPKGYPDIRGLNSLNASRSTWLAGDAIETAIETYTRGLPEALQQIIGVGSLGLHPAIWHQPGTPGYYTGRDSLTRAIMTPAKRLLRRVKETEYSIWPICSNGNHWVIVILHKNQVPVPGEPGKKEWSRVVQAAVLDPFRDSARVEFIHSTLHEWLSKAGQFTFATNYQKTVWVPFQRDGSSCGPRAYWNAKQFLDRLLELHENETRYDEALWADLSGWFNEGFVRDEMIGRCAAAAVRDMNYNARVAVEIVNKAREFSENGLKGTAVWKSAEKMMTPEDMKGKKPESRPTGYLVKTPGVDQLVAPELGHLPGYTNTNINNIENSGYLQDDPHQTPPYIPNQHLISPKTNSSGKKKGKKKTLSSFASSSSSSMSPTFPTTNPTDQFISSPSVKPKKFLTKPGKSGANPIDLTSPTFPKKTLSSVTKKPTTTKTTEAVGKMPFISQSTSTSKNPLNTSSGSGGFLTTATTAGMGSSSNNPIVIGDTFPKGTSTKATTPNKNKPGKRPPPDASEAPPAKKSKPNYSAFGWS